MSPTSHAVISAGTSAVFWYATGSVPGAIVCFLSGIFIDLDHHLDYWLNKKELPLDYKKLLYFSEVEKEGKPYLFLHSYELLALLWIAVFYYGLGPVWSGLVLGLSVHMIADQICNPVRPLAYFFIYRLKHGFHRGKLLTEDDYKKRK